MKITEKLDKKMKAIHGNSKAFKELFDIDIILTEVSNENYLYSKDKINIWIYI